jgi:hypothetical protein
MIRAGLFPLVIDRDDRITYIEALESADRGSLGALADLIVRREKRALVGALGIVRSVSQSRSVTAVIESAREAVEARDRRVRAEMESVKELAGTLLTRCTGALRDVAEQMTESFSGLRDIRADVDFEEAGADRDFWFRHQIISTAKALGYFADLAEHRSWSRLRIRGEPQHEILVSFHGLGRPFRGIMAACASYFRRASSEGGGTEVDDAVPLTDEVFQFNYREDQIESGRRFDRWLEAALIQGLEHWRSSM